MSTPWETYKAGNTTRLRRRPVRHHAATTTTKSAPAAPDFSSMKKDELVAEAERQGIDSSGTKADIIERLES